MIHWHPRNLKVLLSALAFSLVGCEGSSPASGSGGAGCVGNTNLLQNPDFGMTGGGGYPTHWYGVQHAGERAYKVSVRQGELSIDKEGQQHWKVVKQRVDPESLAGKSVLFSAEMRQNMTDEGWTQTLEPGGGLSVVIRGTEPQSPRRKKLLFSSSLEHEPKLGKFDWTPVQVGFDVPAGATRIEVGFLHQANGDMTVRNPVLCVADVDGAASD